MGLVAFYKEESFPPIVYVPSKENGWSYTRDRGYVPSQENGWSYTRDRGMYQVRRMGGRMYVIGVCTKP